jgi:hypothetical protein
VLLDAMAAARTLERYVPLDVTEAMVRRTAVELAETYDGLRVHGIVGDFERHLARIPAPDGCLAEARRAADDERPCVLDVHARKPIGAGARARARTGRRRP